MARGDYFAVLSSDDPVQPQWLERMVAFMDDRPEVLVAYPDWQIVDLQSRVLRDWFSPDNWPPAAQTGLNPVIDVEDISMISMRLDNGVLASYEQCHFTPDYWRNYTVIGDAGRLENMGDEGGDQIHLWTSRRSRPGHPDRVEVIRRETGSHGGADPSLVAEFIRFARDGGRTDVSAVAARQAVAAGVIGTESIRTGVSDADSV